MVCPDRTTLGWSYGITVGRTGEQTNCQLGKAWHVHMVCVTSHKVCVVLCLGTVGEFSCGMVSCQRTLVSTDLVLCELGGSCTAMTRLAASSMRLVLVNPTPCAEENVLCSFESSKARRFPPDHGTAFLKHEKESLLRSGICASLVKAAQVLVFGYCQAGLHTCAFHPGDLASGHIA